MSYGECMKSSYGIIISMFTVAKEGKTVMAVIISKDIWNDPFLWQTSNSEREKRQ